MKERTGRGRWLARAAGCGCAVVVVCLGVAVPTLALLAGAAGWVAFGVHHEAVALAEAHRAHEVAHVGWSFPARVWSASAPMDLPAPRLVAQARARGYVEACPADEPGEVCGRDGTVVARSGTDLEPVLAAWLVGPDAEIREHLPIDRAPDHLLAAIVLAEDDDFHGHWGVDLPGLARATWANVRGGGYEQGASTLTMQVVRGLTQRKDRTLGRKVSEIALAVALDRHLGKDGVLQMYLDMPYLGQDGDFSICGFQAASRYYWGIEAEDLSLAQAATLAAILPAPGRYAPDRHPEVAKERRDRVLRRMGEAGWDVTAALDEPIGASPHPVPGERWPAYVQAVRTSLLEDLGPDVVYGAGLDVHTALDVVVQERSERLLAERVAFLEMSVGRRAEGPLLAAGSVVDPSTGALVAVVDTSLVASTDFSRATQARRQAGSSYKPLVYALAFQPGPDGSPRVRPDDTLPNTPRVFEGTDGWRPRNVGARYGATSSVAWGLPASHNIATAALLERVGGPGPLIAFARGIGFDTTAYPHEMGLALGQGEVTTLEMARFAATVVGGGRRLAASPIVRVVDAAGSVRETLEPPGDPVLSPESAVLTRELMRLVVDQGTGGGVRGGGGYAGYDGEILGKTGTTDDERDLWFVGATPTYAASLWIGYDRPTRIGASASDFSAPLFGWWMREVHADLPLARFPRDVARFPVCTQTGRTPAASCQVVYAPFLPGTAPRAACEGTHAPETGETLADHQSIWDLKAAADAAALAPAAEAPASP